MPKKETKKNGISYRGRKWVQPQPRFPVLYQPWLEGKGDSIRKDLYHRGPVGDELRALVERDRWRWPKKPVYFFSDMHADTDAFVASLVASGGVKKTGPADHNFKLTGVGRKARFIIGGDCFDKGPSSIRLLRAVRMLTKRKGDVRILAGNHDIRMMLGIRSLGLPSDPRTDHFFIRMGPKVVPFLKEIHDEYLQGKRALRDLPTSRECRRRLFPSKRWFNEFPRLASWVMPDSGIEREMKRLRAKMERFEDDVKGAGLTLRTAYAAARKWQQLFLHPKGEFYWFYDQMRLAHREGSFLFIHAGLDDRIARIINESGIKALNLEFRRQVQQDLFDFYYGPLANSIRTKYREVDMPLTRQGVESVRRKGIYAVVHGHLNLLRGQRIMLRKGIVNFQCDSTMDRNTRKKEGLKGPAAAATVFLPEGVAMGVSSDYPYIKTFDSQLK